MSRSSEALRALAATALAALLWGCPPTPADTNNSSANPGGVGSGNAVPSCYAAVAIGAPAPAPGRAVFVLVDQTTGLDEHLRETISRNLEQLLAPGTSFTVATFSAFSQGNYTTVLASGTLEAPLTADQRLHLQAGKVEQMGQCLDQQRGFGIQVANQRVEEATGAAASSFTNSEIMAGLRQLSEAVRASPAEERIVIVVSDLLEHSTVTSFYRQQTIRMIDPAEEMEKAEAHGLIADFDDARVAIIGAGLLAPGSGAAASRPIREREALHRFWEQWFEHSNARLIAYGEPDLVAPIQ